MKKLLASIVLAAAGAAAFGMWSLSTPYKGFQEPVILELPKGTGTRTMAAMLAEQGVIRNGWQFQLARLLRPGTRLQAGEYRFHEPASVWTVYERIRQGDVFLVELRIPEGYNIYEIAESVAAAGLATESEFLAAARDGSLIRDLAPQATTLEGFLFPSTYHVPRRITARDLCRTMTDQFRRQWRSLDASVPVLKAVTLASLVEKETGAAEERKLVAGVYSNRLREGMKMEADPTTIYAARLSGNWRGTIYRSDLQREHPYNTYAVAGLPPGPIANPGRAALEAALHPAATPYLFFVAKPDGSGRHNFSVSLSDHNRAVSLYRSRRNAD